MVECALRYVHCHTALFQCYGYRADYGKPFDEGAPTWHDPAFLHERIGSSKPARGHVIAANYDLAAPINLYWLSLGNFHFGRLAL